MSRSLDRRLIEDGTKFRLFVQPRDLKGFEEPETVRIATSPSKMEPGPSDDRFYVVDAVGKRPYIGDESPPYQGPHRAPVHAGNDGHFDRLDLGGRDFRCATMYATVRRVVDIFEDYFGRRLTFAFESQLPRMELIPLVEWDNAQSGFGFLEFGYGRRPSGGIDRDRPYCENFDVLAHETGHAIVFAVVGYPLDEGTLDYGGFHESAADLVAIVSSLHFSKVFEILLSRTRGNLFTVNELARIGELGQSRQIRIAFNYNRFDPSVEEPHDRSLPLTGALFDVFVELFQRRLVGRGLIDAELARRSTQTLTSAPDDPAIQAAFDRAYSGREEAFADALLDARDAFGSLLTKAWGRVRADGLTYFDVLRAVLASDRESGGDNESLIRDCFVWRGITAPSRLVAATGRRLLDAGHRLGRGP